MKHLEYLAVVLCLAMACTGPNQKEAEAGDSSDPALYVNDFSRPLTEVMADVAKRFDVEIRCKDIPDYLSLDYADFRIHPESLETTLADLTSSAGCSYYEKKGIYYVTRARYSQWTPEQGAAFMEYLKTRYSDKESWEVRRELLRREIRINSGIDKVPEHFEGKVFLGDKREYDGYYVQNLGLEILPGVWCTGALYHPLATAPESGYPLVLNPHGHNPNGHSAEQVQIRCAMEARMGCVAVSYDMFAWGEQPMFDKKYHRTGLAQPVQILNGLRLLDYMLGQDEIDSTRVCVTGCSGGGSQTMFLAALDDRISICVPVVMMSSFFMGGCPCESGTRIHLSGGRTNNVEIASIFAPKPMLVISDGADWTRFTPEVEYPFLQRTYGFYDAADKVFNVHLPEEKHNYNEKKRQPMYRFLAEQFSLDIDSLKGPDGLLDENRCTVEEFDLLKVWGPDGENWPEGAISDPAELAALLHFEKNK